MLLFEKKSSEQLVRPLVAFAKRSPFLRDFVLMPHVISLANALPIMCGRKEVLGIRLAASPRLALD
jgi:hypothetical protein